MGSDLVIWTKIRLPQEIRGKHNNISWPISSFISKKGHFWWLRFWETDPKINQIYVQTLHGQFLPTSKSKENQTFHVFGPYLASQTT